MTQTNRIPLPPVITQRQMFGYDPVAHGDLEYERDDLLKVAHCTSWVPTPETYDEYLRRAEDQMRRRSHRLAATYFLCAAQVAPTAALAHYCHERACLADEATKRQSRDCKVHVVARGNNLTNNK